ncbi:MAG: glycosyltransferase family 4 protein [Saprospiraceae bacterium]
MSKDIDLSIFINDLNAPSEIFLRQLFQALGAAFNLELLVYNGGSKQNGAYSFSVKTLPKPISFRYFFALPGLAIRYKTTNIKFLYRIYLLKQAVGSRIYFPFLFMMSEFDRAIPAFQQKEKRLFFSSIRGSDITVNPFVKPEALMRYSRIIPYLHKLHFLSEKLEQQFIDLGLPPPPSQVIYQGVNFNKFLRDIPLPNDKLRMITVGRFEYIKGIEYLLLACKKLKTKNIEFHCTIVGYGREKEKYLYMIHDLGLSDVVSIQEKTDHEALAVLLSKHNLYVHPHLVTGLSNSMLEAFAAGLKTIAFYSDFGSYKIPEMQDYFSEVPRYDAEQLATTIAQFDINYSISLKQRQCILEKFALDFQIQAFKKFFELERV